MTEQVIPSRFFGRRVVAAAFVLALFGWGVGFYGPPVYLHAVVQRTGWPVPLVSSAVTLHFLAGAFVVANLPRLYRRFGLPIVTSLGSVSLAGGVVGWAVAFAPWQVFVAALFSGIGWVAMGAAAVNAIIAPWFVRNRPAALATAYNGASVGGIAFSPLWVALIAKFGFTLAAAAIGVGMTISIAALSALVFSRTPEKLGQAPDGAPRNDTPAPSVSRPVQQLSGALLWRNRRFLTLACGTALSLFAQIGLIAHLFSLLAPAFGERRASMAMGAATAFAIIGRTVVGWLMPVDADRRLVACASYGVQVAGSLILIAAAGQSVLLLLGVMLFGLGIGNATSLPPLIAQAEFAKEDVQRIVSLTVAIGQASYAFAPAAFGAIRFFASGPGAGVPEDTTLFYAVAAVIQLAAIGCFMFGRRKH
jgi:MFS family permease